jgi:serine/threonine protein kinase
MSSRPTHRGRYRLIAEIGRGGMAEVYLALLQGDLGFNKLVVLKEIRQDLAEDPELMSMFLDEARLAARLRHPNVVETHEVAQEDGHTFMAMEYLEGQPLHRIIQRAYDSGGLPLSIHLRILADMLGGVHHAHELLDWDDTPLGVVHRDVSPQNVFVTYDGVVKVVDFGIAKVNGAISHTRAGIVKGKIAYLAPEQARREDLDRRVDVFAAGVMLWEAVTKTRPWKGRSERIILEQLMSGRFPSARDFVPNLPVALEAILAKALAPERNDRYDTAGELQAAIEGYLDTLGEHVDLRELGKLLATQFADDRARIHGSLEKALHVQRAGGDVTTSTLPRMPRPQSSTDERTVGVRGSARAAEPPQNNPITGSSFPAFVGPTALLPVPQGKRLRPAVMIGILTAAAFSVALWAPWSRPSTAVAARPETSAVVLPAPAAPSRIALNLRALPQDARIFLDGALLESNPFAGVFAADGEPHQIRIEAPGYVTRSQTIKFDQDSTLDLTLTPRPVAVAAEPWERWRHPRGSRPRGRPSAASTPGTLTCVEDPVRVRSAP